MGSEERGSSIQEKFVFTPAKAPWISKPPRPVFKEEFREKRREKKIRIEGWLEEYLRTSR